MRRTAAICISLSLLVASLAAKGPTTRIVIKELDRGSVSEITDRSVLDQFQVWSGRGTSSGPPNQTTEGTQGFIIDWQAGTVDERPGQLRRYEVSFYVTRYTTGGSPLTNAPPEELAYVVLYEHDPLTREGYVYLPGRADEHFRLNVGTILRGVEGHWLRANEAWRAAFASLPAAR